tara:strand:- start:1036 stop:1248 length:213 start_codon:yes stop_codon:yes gene_type:complete
MAKRKYGLSKYDAPLPIQFNKGRGAFYRGYTRTPYHLNTMQHREWQRGFDSAFFAQLKKVKHYETRGRSK